MVIKSHQSAWLHSVKHKKKRANDLLLVHHSSEFSEVTNFIIYFLSFWMHEVSKEKASDIVLLHLTAFRQMTKNFVDADLEIILTRVLNNHEEFFSAKILPIKVLVALNISTKNVPGTSHMHSTSKILLLQVNYEQAYQLLSQ